MMKNETASPQNIEHWSAKKLLRLDQKNSPNIVSSIVAGLPLRSLAALASTSGVPIEDLRRALGLYPAKFKRRQAEGRLTPSESDHLVSIANTIACAINLFAGNKVKAARWFMTPNYALGEITPLQLAKTHTGCRAVESLIGRLEYGVFS